MNKIPTYVDGIASSQAIDTAGEIVDLRGLDISSLVGAHLNWEHFKDTPAQVVGKIIEAKKIFGKKDCENERHLKYWNKCQIPFLYIKARLLDDKKPSAVEAAALFLDDAEHPNEHPFVGFSVEGARLGEKQGMLVPRSIARKVTVTGTNANKSCAAEMIPHIQERKDGFESLFKGELELFSFQPTYEEILEKADKWTSKLHSTGIDHSHAIHGTIGIKKVPIGESHQFEVRHNDKLIGTSPNVKHASAHAKKYIGSLNKGETGHEKGVHTQKYGSSKGHLPANPNVSDYPQSSMGGAVRYKPGSSGYSKEMGSVIDAARKKHPKQEVDRVRNEIKDMPTPNLPKSEKMDHNLSKAMEAGSGMSAPSQLVQGAALGKESLEGNMQKMHKKERSKNYSDAENAYAAWEKRDKFKSYMKKRMPHLADGEVDAVGRVLAFKDSLDKKKKISSMYAGHNKKE